MREILETPERAVVDSRIEFGWYRSPFQNLNLLDAGPSTPGGFHPRWLRRLRLKEWEHFGVFLGDFFLGIAVVDAKFMGVSWCCVFDRSSGAVNERKKQFLPGKIRIPGELWNASVDLNGGPDYRILLENRLQKGFHRLVVHVKKHGAFPGVEADLTFWERPEQVQALIALLPFPDGRPFFTHKAPSFAEGEATIGSKTVRVKEPEAVGLIDFHRAFYPRNTFWKWATFAGIDGNGDLIGINLTRNIIEQDNLYNENGVWFRNTLRPVGPAEFRIPKNGNDPWHIRSKDGDVDLEFRPINGRSETINMGPLVSEYTQPIGLFSGKVTDAAGIAHTVENMIGMAEEHRVTW